MEALWYARHGISPGSLFFIGGATWLALAWFVAVLLWGESLLLHGRPVQDGFMPMDIINDE